MRTRLSLALGLATLLAAPAAFAQEPTVGQAGTFAISAERLMGYTWSKTKSEGTFDPGDQDTEFEGSRTQFDLLARGNVDNPFVAPRLAFDYFVINGLSVGGAIAYYTYEEDDPTQTTDGTSVDLDEQSGDGFLFAPRVGYLFMFSPMLGIWPRAGVTYASATNKVNDRGPGPDNDLEVNANVFDLTLEGMLVITPVPHGGFTVGPTVEIPLAGSGEYTLGDNSNDLDKVRITSIGIQAGLLVWF